MPKRKPSKLQEEMHYIYYMIRDNPFSEFKALDIDLIKKYRFKYDRFANALDICIRLGKPDHVKYLLANGFVLKDSYADIYFNELVGKIMRSSEERIPGILGVMEILRPFMKKNDLRSFEELFPRMAYEQNWNMIKMVLESDYEFDPSINIMIDDNESVLGWTIFHGHVETVKMLSKYPRLLSFVDLNRETPLVTAVRRDNVEIAKILLEAGANFDQVIPGGDKAVHNIRSIPMVNLFLHHGIDIEARNKHGQTLIHCCVNRGIDLIEYLVNEVGVDPKVKDNYGTTAASIMNKRGPKEYRLRAIEILGGLDSGEELLEESDNSCSIVKYLRRRQIS